MSPANAKQARGMLMRVYLGVCARAGGRQPLSAFALAMRYFGQPPWRLEWRQGGMGIVSAAGVSSREQVPPAVYLSGPMSSPAPTNTHHGQRRQHGH